MNGAKISIDPKEAKSKHSDEAKTKNSYEDNQPLLQGSHQPPSIFFASFQISIFSSFLFVSAKVVTILLKVWFCNVLYWIYMNLIMSLVWNRIIIIFFKFNLLSQGDGFLFSGCQINTEYKPLMDIKLLQNFVCVVALCCCLIDVHFLHFLFVKIKIIMTICKLWIHSKIKYIIPKSIYTF